MWAKTIKVYNQDGEQIEILEHNNAEYERLINEMLMEIGMTDPDPEKRLFYPKKDMICIQFPAKIRSFHFLQRA